MEWPEYDCVAITQDSERDVFFWKKREPSFFDGYWSHQSGDGLCSVIYCMDKSPKTLATDHTTAIVTREMWQDERDKIQRAGKGIERKKPKPKASADGWVRNRGRTEACPVPAWQSVTVVTRDGHALDFKRAGNVNWKHKQSTGDVMRWKLHKPAEQQALEDCEPVRLDADIVFPSGVIRADGPLEWRDRIYELDTQLAEVEALYQRQIGEIDVERGWLVGKLKAEGLALVERGVQTVEDMSDPKNWREGDLIKSVGGNTSHYTSGNIYRFVRMSEEYGSARAIDNRGQENGMLPQFFEWHSRPAT
ncbi:hypothetical protein KLEP174_gp80 [Pseudomonas phage vB_PcuM_ KLEP17-4]|nr:hypothetical protein KLEP174_gp80 [Pseudomonas phage vB_PcuM_ KLEP17-4]